MQNNKAFTMIELIIVIIIIGVILVFAIPNIVATMERNKKDAMAVSAKDFIEKTRNCIIEGKRLNASLTCGYPTTSAPSATYSLKDIDVNNQIQRSTAGDEYDRDNSTVTVTKNGDVYEYQAVLKLKDNSATCTLNYGEDSCH